MSGVSKELRFDPEFWDVAAWMESPTATWGERDGLTREVYYEGEAFEGKPTRIFAYYGCPEGEGPFPAMVLVHGGGGKAFKEWADYWAQRGYAALAMDLSGNGPDGRLPDGGPDAIDENKFKDFSIDDASDMWTHQAVAAIIRGHSLLLSREEVDSFRTALTGISWGGYLTCIVAGLDHRFKAAVPVYGCGFIDRNSIWNDSIFSKMPEARRNRWADYFDPSRFLAFVRCPMLFVDGTNDFAYPLDSVQKSYNLVLAPLTLSTQINRPHGHIWTFGEVDVFIDSLLNKGEPLPEVGKPEMIGPLISTSVRSARPLVGAELNYTTDEGPWQQREWKEVPANIQGSTVSASVPAERPLICYLRVLDSRGAAVSTPYIEI